MDVRNGYVPTSFCQEFQLLQISSSEEDCAQNSSLSHTLSHSHVIQLVFSHCLHISRSHSPVRTRGQAHREQVGVCVIQVAFQEAQHLLLEDLIGEVLDNRMGNILLTDNVQEVISQLL